MRARQAVNVKERSTRTHFFFTQTLPTSTSMNNFHCRSTSTRERACQLEPKSERHEGEFTVYK